jgi:hypothetical protein
VRVTPLNFTHTCNVMIGQGYILRVDSSFRSNTDPTTGLIAIFVRRPETWEGRNSLTETNGGRSKPSCENSLHS